MVFDTSPREKPTLERRHTFAAWARVTDRTWVLASLAVGFAFSVVTAVLEGVLPNWGPPTATQVGYRKTLRWLGRLAVVSLAAALVACGGGPASQTPASQPSPGSTRPPALLKLTSSLDGQPELPLRTRWIASPEPADAVVTQVDFLIDGKLIWTKHDAPYAFASEDNVTTLGYLITTWLAPGQHTFTARATDVAGSSVTDAVTATVPAAPQPPASLRGMWTRTVTAQDLEKAGASIEPPPTGQWELVFDQVGAWHLDPRGGGLANQYDVQGDTINVYAPIEMEPLGGDSISRYGHRGFTGTDCNPSGPFGSYHWSVSGGKLTLTTINEGCHNRRAVWEGTWTLT
jgi:hypothetical protein